LFDYNILTHRKGKPF